MQRLSFELLRTAISRHDNLMSVTNLQGFIPYWKKESNQKMKP